MAEKIRKKKYTPIRGADGNPQVQAEPQVYQEDPVVQVASQPEAEDESMPYAEYGGLPQTLSEQKQTAPRRREEALQEWERRLREQSSARMALVGAVKPQDTSREQRKLRNLAIGQAAGELFGALFGGVYGLGKKGGGYVPKMPGLYRSTLDRVQQLKDNDIAADQRFRGIIGSMMERDAGDRVTMARDQYQHAAAEEKQLRMAEDYAQREEYRAKNRREFGEMQAEYRRILQKDRHEQRLGEQHNAAGLKSSVGGSSAISGDVAYVTKLLLPKTRTTKTNDGKVQTRTVKDVERYNKQEVAAATALAQQIVPIRSRYALSDYDVWELHQAIIANPTTGISWQKVAEALAEGYNVEEILLFIDTN